MNRNDARGRPLRFLLVILLCWTGGRLAFSLDWSLPSRSTAVAAEKIGRPRNKKLVTTSPPSFARTSVSIATALPHVPPLPIQGDGRIPGILAILRSEDRAFTGHSDSGETAMLEHDEPGKADFTFPSATPAIATTKAKPGHWRTTAWLLWRAKGNADALAGTGQLGGSQGGFRIDHDLLPSASPARLAAYARMTAALDRPHAPEAATGIAFQPSRAVSVSLAVERRIALGTGARDAFAFVAAGGIGPVYLPVGLKLEGYGQAGMVGLRHRDAFADGRIALLHPLRATPVSVGLSLSGGAQPHIARLDIGPAIEMRVPIGGQPTRIIAEWRERIAGHARPGSGLALTLAADF